MTHQDIHTELDNLLSKFFIMRKGTPDGDLEELKARNATGAPEGELKTALSDLLLQGRIDENNRHNETCHNKTTAFDATEHKLGSSDFIDRLTQLKENKR